jgi:hypothetical protein
MQIVAFHKGEQNDAAFDPWSLVHMASGLALGLMGFSLKQSMVAAVAYDVVEYAFESSEAGQNLFNTSGPESVANVGCDLGLFALGHQLGTHWNEG